MLSAAKHPAPKCPDLTLRPKRLFKTPLFCRNRFTGKNKRHPSRPISRVLCDRFPRPAIISLGARVATRLQQPTRGSNGSSRTALPEGGSPLFGLASDGGCQAVRFTADAGGLLHRRFTLARCRAMRFSVALIRQVAPPRELPGVVLCAARTFLDPPKGTAIARPTWIPRII